MIVVVVEPSGFVIVTVCVPSPLSTTLASGDFPSLPSFTIVFVSDPSGFVMMIVCVPSPLSTTLAVGDFPSLPS